MIETAWYWPEDSSRGQNRQPRNRPPPIWKTDFPKGAITLFSGERILSSQHLMLEQQEIHFQKKPQKCGSSPHTIC